MADQIQDAVDALAAVSASIDEFVLAVQTLDKDKLLYVAYPHDMSQAGHKLYDFWYIRPDSVVAVKDKTDRHSTKLTITGPGVHGVCDREEQDWDKPLYGNDGNSWWSEIPFIEAGKATLAADFSNGFNRNGRLVLESPLGVRTARRTDVIEVADEVSKVHIIGDPAEWNNCEPGVNSVDKPRGLVRALNVQHMIEIRP